MADDEEIGSIADEPEDMAGAGAGEGEEHPGAGEPELPDGIGSIADDDGGDGGTDGKPQGEAKKEEAEDWELTVDEKEFPMPAENLKSFSEACRKAGLSKEQAEAVLSWHKGQYASTQAWAKQEQERTIRAWNKEILEDAEYGGANYRRTIADARKFLHAFDESGEVRKLLRETGGEHHPAIIRAVAKAGAAMGEHAFVTSGSQAKKSTTPLWERVYGASTGE